MTFTTIINAIDPLDGKLKVWGGPNIEAESWELGEMFLQSNGLGYCKIDGTLVKEIIDIDKTSLN
jgi:hypothetical protein